MVWRGHPSRMICYLDKPVQTSWSCPGIITSSDCCECSLRVYVTPLTPLHPGMPSLTNAFLHLYTVCGFYLVLVHSCISCKEWDLPTILHCLISMCAFSVQRTGHMMQSLLRSVYRTGSRVTSPNLLDCAAPGVAQSFVKPPSPCSWNHPIGSPIIAHNGVYTYGFCVRALVMRGFSTVGTAKVSLEEENSSSPAIEHPPRIKFKRPDKTARHIMNILNKEAVDKVRAERAIPDVQPGCILQMRVQVPENKRRESTLKGIVIARRNAGINTTFRLRRLVAGVGVESVFPLYSPNIKEIKILDRKKVRRAKLYYLRDRMNALKK